MMRRWGRRLVIILGGLAVLLAAVFAVSPSLLPAGVRAPLLTVTERADHQPVVIGLAVIAVLAALAYLRSAGPAPRRRDPLVDATPETASRPVTELGAEFTRRAARERRYSGDDRSLDGQLRDRAKEVLTWELDCTPAEAERMLDAGTWTDDQVAAATVSTTQSYPVAHRLRQWAQPQTARKQEVDRTVTAMYRLVTEDDTASLPGGET